MKDLLEYRIEVIEEDIKKINSRVKVHDNSFRFLKSCLIGAIIGIMFFISK